MRSKSSGLLLHVSGGIGNQLFQIARLTASEHSRITICRHRSATTETIEEFGVDKEFLERNNIKIVSECPPLDRSVDILLVGMGNRFKNLAWRKAVQRSFSTNLGDDHVPLGSRAWGFFQNRSPSPGEIEYVKAFTGLREVTSSERIAIHFRGGDFEGKTFGVLSGNYFERAIHAIQESSGRAWKIIVVTAKKELAQARHVLKRLPGDVEFLKSESVRDDFEALRTSTFLISSNSTFSYWAALTAHKNQKTFVPNPSFRAHPNLPYPDTWNSIPSGF
jgi:hypothetical protein